jgi:hypothetical protein
VQAIAHQYCVRKSNKQLAAAIPELATAVVFATAADLHYFRSLGILTVLAAVLAVFFGRTITRTMRALA